MFRLADVVLTGLFGGAVADRQPPPRTMIVVSEARATVLIGVFAAWTVMGTPSAPALIAIIIALGAGQASCLPTLQV